MHALAVSESVRETYHLDELSDSMWEDIYEVRSQEREREAESIPTTFEFKHGDLFFNAVLSGEKRSFTKTGSGQT